MATSSWIRCGHCLTKIQTDRAREVGLDLLCETCARLAGAPPAPSLPSADILDDAIPSARRESSEQIVEKIWRVTGRPPGTREDPRGDRQIFNGPVDEAFEVHRLPNVVIRKADDRPIVRRVLDDVDGWTRGRWWFVRLPILLFLAYVWIRVVADPSYQSIFKGLNLGIHELGHYVFAPFGELMAAWGGSLFQCLVPLAAIPMFVKQRDYFAIFFAFGWLATNFFDVAFYAEDAVAMALPLVTPGGGHPVHDWNYILGAKGWLRHTESIAGLHWFLGHLSMVVAIGGGAWVTGRMLVHSLRGD
jgi:hypothetical protein